MPSSAFGMALRMVARTTASAAWAACGCEAMYSSTDWNTVLAMLGSDGQVREFAAEDGTILAAGSAGVWVAVCGVLGSAAWAIRARFRCSSMLRLAAGGLWERIAR